MGKQPILKSHRRPDIETTVVAVRTVKFGDGSYPVIAGPAAVESEDQINASADAVAEAGGSVLRAGTFIAGSSPYEYRGVGPDAVWMLEHAGRRAGLPVATEVLEPAHVEAAAEHIDVLEVGPGNMQNFVLLAEAGKSGKPIMLKRGLAATVEEWLLSAEYILTQGNRNVILCERGIRTFETATRNTFDVNAIPLVKRLSHLPIIGDPSHATGAWYLVEPVGLAAIAAGADGLIVEVHPEPDHALSDGAQSLTPKNFAKLIERTRTLAQALGRDLAPSGASEEKAS